MIRRRQVAAGDADPGNGLRAVRVVARGGEDERERQGVGGVPLDLDHLLAGQRIGAGGRAGEPHHVAAVGIGVRRGARRRPLHLLEEEELARCEGRHRCHQRCRRGPRRQAAVEIAPGVEGDLVVRRHQRQGGERLEHHRAVSPFAGQHGGMGGEGRAVRPRAGAHREGHPGAGVRPVVEEVVDQPGVAAHRHPLARRAEVGLGGGGVLVVAELIPHVGQQLDQRHPHVRRVALPPGRRDGAQAVEHQPPEAPVVLGEIIDRGLIRHRRGARRVRLAVEVGRALHLEAEFDVREAGIEPRERRQVDWITGVDQPQAIRREVARRVGAHHEQMVRRRLAGELCGDERLLQGRHGRGGGAGDVRERQRPERPHRRDPHAAVDPHVRRGQPGGDGAQQAHRQEELAQAVPLGMAGGLAVQHLEEVDAVQNHLCRGVHHRRAALGVAADVAGHRQTSRVSSAVRRWPSARRR